MTKPNVEKRPMRHIWKGSVEINKYVADCTRCGVRRRRGPGATPARSCKPKAIVNRARAAK